MPLLAVGLNGELYEENSIRDDGKGIGRLPTFADEGSTVFGALDQRQIKNRAIHKARIKKIAKMKIAQERKKKKIIAAQDRKRKAAQEQAIKFEKARQLAKDKKIAKLHHKAKQQAVMGYEYNDLIGNIHEGFEGYGEVVGNNFTYEGSDFSHAESFGGNTILGSHHMGEYDQGLGWGIKIKRPKISIKAPKTLKAVVKDIGKVAAKTVTAPVQLTAHIAKNVPIVKDVYKGVDKLTGGTLTSVERVVDLPNKIAAGKPIKKADLMEAVMMAVKVGAIAASGGSAASLVSVGAGALKQGPLGKSALGKNLLGATEIVAGGMTIKQIIENQAKSQAKSLVVKEIEKKTGVPFSLIEAVHGASAGQGSIAEKTKMFATKIGEDKLKKAGLGDAATQAILSGNAQALGVMVKDAPNLAMSQAQREAIAAKVKLVEQASMDKLKEKLEQKLGKAKTQALNIESLKDKLDKEVNEALKKQMSQQLAKMVEDNAKTQDEVIAASSEYQVEGMKSAVKVAAAEEGRYETGSSYGHPLVELNKKIRGAA